MTISSLPFFMSSSSSKNCDQDDDFSLQSKSFCSESLNVTMKPAIRNRSARKTCLENNEKNSWRKYGIEKRKQLLEEDKNSGGSSFIIHEHTNIKRYFEIANRVLEQFRSAYQEDKNPEDAYLMGNRLVKFICEVLPTHNQYNNPDVVGLRIKSQNHLAQVRMDIENVALKIDRFYYNKNLHLDKENSRSQTPIEVESFDFAINERSFSKTAEKHVTFDLNPSQLDQLKNISSGDTNKKIDERNYDASFSRFPYDNQDHQNLSFTHDVPDMSFSSGSSSESQSSSSIDSDKLNMSYKTKSESSKGCRVTYENIETAESLFCLESSLQDTEDKWEPFGDWKIEDGFKSIEHMEKSKTIPTDFNSFNDCDEQYKNKSNLEDEPEVKNYLEQTHNHNDNSVDRDNYNSNSSSNIKSFDDDKKYESVNEVSAECYDTDPQVKDINAYSREQNNLITLDISSESEHSYYEDAYSDYEDTQELTFVERIALENTSHSIDRLHEVDGDDSDAEDSWAQEEEIDGECFDRGNAYHTSQSTFDIMMTSEEEIYTDSDDSDNESVSNSINPTDDDDNDHDDFVKEVSDEFAEFDSCSGGEKTTSTAETEALTVEEYSDDENSVSDNNDMEDRNGILGIARRDGYVPTLEDITSGYNVTHHITFKKESENGPKKLDYLESRLRSLENTRKQVKPTSSSCLSSKNEVKSLNCESLSTGIEAKTIKNKSHVKPPISQRQRNEIFSSEPVSDLPSLSRVSKQKELKSLPSNSSNIIHRYNPDPSRSSDTNVPNRCVSPYDEEETIKSTINIYNNSPGKKEHRYTDSSSSPNVQISKSLSPSTLNMVRKHSIDLNKGNQSVSSSPISSKPTASCASPRLSTRLERIKKTAAWKRKYNKNPKST